MDYLTMSFDILVSVDCVDCRVLSFNSLIGRLRNTYSECCVKLVP